jgi:uncharacterized protein (DUF1697 family)
MPQYIAFLRAINVTGRFVKMEALRAQFEALQFKDVQTFINSGNVIFSSAAKDTAALESKIEKQLAPALGFATEAFVRTHNELAQLAQCTPFTPAAYKTAADVVVGFIKTPLTAAQHTALMALKTAADEFHVREHEVFWLTRVSQHQSKFSNGVFERKLNTVATWRRVSTVHNLMEKLFS